MFEKIILSIYFELKYQLCSTHYFSNTAKKIRCWGEDGFEIHPLKFYIKNYYLIGLITYFSRGSCRFIYIIMPEFNEKSVLQNIF